MKIRHLFIIASIAAAVVCRNGICAQSRQSHESICVPPSYGSITGRYTADSDSPLVIYIKDVHTSFDAQKNIAHIIQFFAAQYGVQTIATEGAAGVIDTAELTAFPDTSVRKNVADFFFRQGVIDGAEYLSISRDSDNPIHITGVEDRALYQTNLNAYRCVVQRSVQMRELIEYLALSIPAAQDKLFSEEMRAFISAVELFHSNQTDFISYFESIIQFADLSSVPYKEYTNITRMEDVLAIEKEIDTTRVDVERAFLIGDLKARVPDAIAAQIMEREIQFKVNAVSSAEYCLYLQSLAREYEVDLHQYANLNRFFGYTGLFENIEKDELIDECSRLENRIYDTLLTTDDQRFVLGVSRYAHLIRNCAELKLSPAMFDQFQSYRNRIPFGEMIAGLERLTGSGFDAGSFDESLFEHFETFYITAHQRESAMAQATLRLSDTSAQKKAILIAGGYHADGITGYLRDHNVSYIVVTPAGSGVAPDVAYLSLLSDFKTPLDRFLAAYTGTLKVASWLAADPLVYPDRKTVLTAKMKTLFACTKLFDLYRTQKEQFTDTTKFAQKQGAIERRLRDSINRIIRLAGYESVMHIASVEITQDDLIADIRFATPHSTAQPGIMVRCYDEHTGDFDAVAADHILETVSLATGVREEFFDYPGYLAMKIRHQLAQRVVLRIVAQQSVTITNLVATISSDRQFAHIPDDMIRGIIQALMDYGIIESVAQDENGRPLYSLTVDPAAQMVASILGINTGSQDNFENPLRTELIVIDVNALDESLLSSFAGLETVSSISVEPGIAAEHLYAAFKSLLQTDEPSENIPVQIVREKGFAPGSESLMIMANHDQHASAIYQGPAVRLSRNLPRVTIPSADAVHPLTESQKDMWELAAAGDKQTEARLFEEYRYIAARVAKKMEYVLRTSPHHRTVMDVDDLVRIAEWGLTNAIRTYNPNRGVPFGAYASVVARNEVRAGLASANWVKASVGRQIGTMKTARKELERQNHRPPSSEELAEYLNTSKKKIDQLREWESNRILSLDEPVTSEAGSSARIEFIPDTSEESPEETVISEQRRQLLSNALGYLPQREAEIIRLHHLKGLPFQQIGEYYGVSRSRVQQIEVAAMEKLKYILTLRMTFGASKLDELKTIISTAADNFKPRNRELLLLTLSDDLTDFQIAQRLATNHVTIREERQKLIKQICARCLEQLSDRTMAETLEYNLEQTVLQLLHNSFGDRQTFMADILEDFSLRAFDPEMSIGQIRQSLSDYDRMLSQREQEVLMLIYYEGFTSLQAAEIMNIPQQKVVAILQSLKRKIFARLLVMRDIDDHQRTSLAEAAVEAINNLPLRDRTILLESAYGGASSTELAQQSGLTPAGVRVARWSALRKAQRYMAEQISFAVLMDGYSDVLTDPGHERVEALLTGLFFDIPRESFSDTEPVRPQSLPDVLKLAMSDRIPVGIDDATLDKLMIEYTYFLSEREKQVLMLRYAQGMTLTEISESTGITKNTLTPLLYRQIFPAVDAYLRTYKSCMDYGLDTLFGQAASMLETMIPRERFILVYYGYDHLPVLTIAEALNIGTHQDNPRRKLELAQRNFRTALQEKTASSPIARLLRDNVSTTRYILHWMKFHVDRQRFHVPEYSYVDKQPVVDADMLSDHYDFAFLRNLYAWLKPDYEPTEMELRELSALLDTLSDQQFYSLYHRYALNKSRKEIAEAVAITEVSLNTILKTMKKKLTKRLDFLAQFSPDERSKLRGMLAESIDHLLVVPEYKTMLIYLYYDALANKETAELLGFENPSNSPYQKTQTIKKLQQAFAERIEDVSLHEQFTGSTVNIMEFLYTLKAEIPRERFGVDESPKGRPRADLKPGLQTGIVEDITETAVETDDKQSTIDRAVDIASLFSQAQVTRLFEQFDFGQVENLIEYLEGYASYPNEISLPHPLIVHRNPIFRPIRAENLSGNDLVEYLSELDESAKLSVFHIQLLRSVLERCRYLPVNAADRDVLVIDLDSLEIPTVMPAYNGRVRRELSTKLARVNGLYAQKGRTPCLVFFSQQYPVTHIEAFLGRDLSAALRYNGNRIYGADMLRRLGDTSNGQAYRQFFAELGQVYPVHSVNFKLFTGKESLQRIGHAMGVIQASPDSTVFEALDIFSQVHPDESVDFVIRNSGDTVSDVIEARDRGYGSLAGTELEPLKRSAKRRPVARFSLLDSAL